MKKPVRITTTVEVEDAPFDARDLATPPPRDGYRRVSLERRTDLFRGRTVVVAVDEEAPPPEGAT